MGATFLVIGFYRVESSFQCLLGAIVHIGRSRVVTLRYDLLVPLSAGGSLGGVAPSFSFDLLSVHGIRTELHEGIGLVNGRSIYGIFPCPKRGDLHPFRYGTKVRYVSSFLIYFLSMKY